MFVKVAREAFGGLGHLYDGGTWFDEGNTQFLNTSYVQSVARETYNAMTAADPEAVWIDSAWRFGASAAFWEANNGQVMEYPILHSKSCIFHLNHGFCISNDEFRKGVSHGVSVRPPRVAEYRG